MLKKYIILFIVLISFTKVFSQAAFKRTYGSIGYAKGNSLVQTTDGGYLCTGSTSGYSNGATDLFLFKTDSLGNVQWIKNYGGLNVEIGNHIVPSHDGNYLICGYTNSFGNGGYDIYLLKVTPNGDTLWTQTYGGSDWDFGNGVYVSSTGSIFIAAQTYSFDNNTPNGLLIKTDALGNEIFKKAFGGSNEENFNAIVCTTNNTIALAGYTNSYGGGEKDAYVILTDTMGNKIDSLIMGGIEDDIINDIAITADDGFITAGYTTTNSAKDIYELRLDSNLNHLWTAKFANAVANTIVQTTDINQYAIGGYSTNINTGNAITAFVWVGTSAPGEYIPYFCPFKNFNPQPDVVNQMIKVPGGWCAIGTTESFGPGLSSVFLLKTNATLTACSENYVLSNNENIEEKINPLYPNPTSTQLNLQFKKPVKQLSITLYNAIGQQVFTKNYSNISTIVEDVAAFDNGLYLIQIIADGIVGSQRLVIAK